MEVIALEMLLERMVYLQTNVQKPMLKFSGSESTKLARPFLIAS